MGEFVSQADILFVLRGRPGLGHVIPGLAIAQGFACRGYKVAVMTYANGQTFLDRSNYHGLEILRLINVADHYLDWPGLDLYDHGVRQIGPALTKMRPSLCIFGGEYTMGPVTSAAGVRSAMIFNPEIMEDNPRNELPSRLFCNLFSFCDYLIPLSQFSSESRYLSEFEPLKDRLTPSGPFCFPARKPALAKRADRTVLIANGGGVNFPHQTASYSSSNASSADWLEETRYFTIVAARTVVSNMRDNDRLYVFSCLGDEFNNSLENELGAKNSVEIYPPCDYYYDVLGATDLVISRSGNGFIADVQMSRGVVLLWGLSGHDEQRKNADGLANRRPLTQFCKNADELCEVIEEVLAGRKELAAAPSIIRPDLNVEALIEHLEKFQHVKKS